MKYTISIAPAITVNAYFLSSIGLGDIGVAHPTKWWMKQLPRVNDSTPGSENLFAPPAMLAWLAQRLSPEQIAAGGGKLFGDTEADGITQFEEYAIGANPIVNEGDAVKSQPFPADKKWGFEHQQNALSTGIQHIVEIGDGVTFRPATKGTDYTLANIGDGTTEKIENYGLVHRKRTIPKNVHSWTDRANAIIRLRLIWEIEA